MTKPTKFIGIGELIISTSTPWTATEDCWVSCQATNDSGTGAWATVNGMYIMNSGAQDRWFNHCAIAPVKKGQQVQGGGRSGCSVSAYKLI